ncbi:MAG TPA: hypothetical protein VJB90_03285 [Candidatus Nanoarchaeia archaeon]|nr:hypothetical protein [Candidatus Nanoarchaeia archaeon]
MTAAWRLQVRNKEDADFLRNMSHDLGDLVLALVGAVSEMTHDREIYLEAIGDRPYDNSPARYLIQTEKPRLSLLGYTFVRVKRDVAAISDEGRGGQVRVKFDGGDELKLHLYGILQEYAAKIPQRQLIDETRYPARPYAPVDHSLKPSHR